MRQITTCVDNISFEAAHYTPVRGVPTIHGHTFRVTVCVSGSPKESTGWVIDFDVLKEIANRVIRKYNFSLLAPESDSGKIEIKGPFKANIVYLRNGLPTAENLGKEICEELARELTEISIEFSEINVKVFEGSDNYSVIRC